MAVNVRFYIQLPAVEYCLGSAYATSIAEPLERLASDPESFRRH